MQINRIITLTSLIVSSLVVVVGSILLFSRWRTHTATHSPLPGMVIILNGSAAVGKTSIIKAFQARSSQLWLGIGIDTFFVASLPAKIYLENSNPEHHVVMRGEASQDEHGKLFKLTFGTEGNKVIRGMHRAIAAYAWAGNNVIVDYILYDPSWLADLEKALTGLKVILVGVRAPLAILQEREKARGTSPEGHARSIYQSVHEGLSYGLEIDTSLASPEACAAKIEDYLASSGRR